MTIYRQKTAIDTGIQAHHAWASVTAKGIIGETQRFTLNLN